MLDSWRQTACYSLASTDYQGDAHADNSGFVKGATIETQHAGYPECTLVRRAAASHGPACPARRPDLPGICCTG
jgi:hypothetical protein